MSKIIEAQAYWNANKAHIKKEVKHLLLPFISTRLYVYLNHRDHAKRKKTFYANEHRCTYSQCMAGFVPHIVLHKHAGFQGLVQMAESLGKKALCARIYYRPPGGKDFNITLREWEGGILNPKYQDPPPFGEDEAQVVHYFIKENRLFVSAHPPFEDIDFKKEIDQNLLKKP